MLHSFRDAAAVIIIVMAHVSGLDGCYPECLLTTAHWRASGNDGDDGGGLLVRCPRPGAPSAAERNFCQQGKVVQEAIKGTMCEIFAPLVVGSDIAALIRPIPFTNFSVSYFTPWISCLLSSSLVYLWTLMLILP